jgi:hypothetical protein
MELHTSTLMCAWREVGVVRHDPTVVDLDGPAVDDPVEGVRGYDGGIADNSPTEVSSQKAWG